MTRKSVLALIATAGLTVAGIADAGGPWILPLPRHEKDLGDQIKLDGNVKTPPLIIDLSKTRQGRIGAELILDRLAQTGLSAKPEILDAVPEDASASPLVLVLTLASNDDAWVETFLAKSGGKLETKRQGYSIVSGKHAPYENVILITGADPVGLLYGCVSFKQLIQEREGQGGARQVIIARRDVGDYPDYEWRVLGSLSRVPWPRDRKNKKKLVEMGKRYVDEMLEMKINGVNVGSRVIPGLSQQSAVTLDDEALKELDWLREVTDYGRERGIGFAYFGSMAVANDETAGDNPKFKDLMYLRGNYFTWSDDDLLRQRAKEIGKQCERLGIELISIHNPDTVNENWANRGPGDRKRFGDDRAAGDAHVSKVFHDTLKEINPDFVICPVLHPYSAVYMKNQYYQDFVSRFASLAPEDVCPHMRESHAGLFQKMTRLYQRPYCLYFEPHRSVRSGETRIGLDRAMLTTTPRYMKSFDNDRSDNILYDVWAYTPMDLHILNQYAWWWNSPGAESDFSWADRHTPFDGAGSEQFFDRTLLPICARVFGDAAAPEMVKLFKLQILTAFLLQPSGFSQEANKFIRNWGDPKKRKPDFSRIIEEQVVKLNEANRVVSDLAKRPEEFPLPSQQEEFMRYYKEVKLLHWLAPIRLREWRALRLLEKGDVAKAKDAIKTGLELVEKARKGLPADIAAVESFHQKRKGCIRTQSVRCGPGASYNWRADYLDKYFKSQLETMLANADRGLAPPKGDPLTDEQRKEVKKAALTATRATEPITLDGIFSEACWKKGQPAVFVKVLKPGEEELFLPDAKGEVTAAWDDENLYLAMTFKEDDMDSLMGTTGPRDRMIFSDDIFEIFLQPDGSKNYGHLLSNVANRKWDGVPKRMAFGMENDLRWNPEWETAVNLSGSGQWTAEVKIPFTAFDQERFEGAATPPKPGDEWKVNVGRERRGTECSSIAPCVSFHDTSRYFDLVFEPAAE